MCYFYLLALNVKSNIVCMSEVAKIKVLIADDHPLIRRALRDTLQEEPDIEIVGEAENGAEAVDLAAQHHPDVVIVDISMPVMNGVEATKRIKAADPLTLVLVLTITTDINIIYNILQAGASGYLLKSVLGHEVIRTIRVLMDGDLVLDADISAEFLRFVARHKDNGVRLDPTGSHGQLSRRAIEVLTAAAQGLSNKEIATELSITEATVKGYFVEIFGCLNVRSRTEAVVVSLKTGIINLDDIVVSS